ncbi:DUF4035 domain-containing protein [Luteimonas sp. S4-F44]|uniref:DUF4035 domain-containing protein n=1 Tax=Luteimonas sp. S4-F44 TaxID=2925842 RepID=UPI001F53B900|nr:DUF4035 domain-containing protein [Luteimonas sp. S4-F44]UNK43451.1 DUF4035 domain-containing protein [Luteimonas sp. S4-F44]
MGRTLKELRETMEPEELVLWMARDRESPIGMERDDFHAAQVAAAIGGGRIADLMPRWGTAGDDDADAALDRLMGG